MNIEISNHPTQKYVYDNNTYDIKRLFVEHSFVFNTERKYVSLIGQVVHYVIVDEYMVDLPYMNKTAELVATNKTLVYADNGDYVVYEKDEAGNIIYEDIVDEDGNKIGIKPKIVDESRGVIGEYEFFEKLRTKKISINTIISNVVKRADILLQFN